MTAAIIVHKAIMTVKRIHSCQSNGQYLSFITHLQLRLFQNSSASLAFAPTTRVPQLSAYMNQGTNSILEAWEAAQNQEPSTQDAAPSSFPPGSFPTCQPKCRKRHRCCPASHLPAKILQDSPEGIIIAQSLDYCEGKVLSDDLCRQILYNLGICHPNPDDFSRLRAKIKRELYLRRKSSSASDISQRFLNGISTTSSNFQGSPLTSSKRHICEACHCYRTNGIITSEKSTQTEVPGTVITPPVILENPLLDPTDERLMWNSSDSPMNMEIFEPC